MSRDTRNDCVVSSIPSGFLTNVFCSAVPPSIRRCIFAMNTFDMKVAQHTKQCPIRDPSGESDQWDNMLWARPGIALVRGRYATDHDSDTYHRVVHGSTICYKSLLIAFRDEPILVALFLTDLALEQSLARHPMSGEH